MATKTTKNKRTAPKRGTHKRLVERIGITKLSGKNFFTSWKMLPIIVLVLAVGYFVISLTRASTCTVDANLVNSCRPWLGGWSRFYSADGLVNQITEHETRIGRQLDVVHDYPAGNQLSAGGKTYINRPNTILLTNWKPAEPWKNGDGSNATVNAAIDQMADSANSVAPKKFMLIVGHEPENDVSGGAAACPANQSYNTKGQGTPAEYRAMWRNVRNRFDAKGVTNVVWAMDYMGMGGSRFDCMIKDLWPGNDLVDWVMWNPYPSGNGTWNSHVGRGYKLLESLTDSDHAFTSKPWGLGEWGAWYNNDQAKAKQLYADAKTAAEGGEVKNADGTSMKYPRLKLYTIFDSFPIGGTDSRTLYPTVIGSGRDLPPDQSEQNAYNEFAQSKAFDNPADPPADQTNWKPVDFVTTGGAIGYKSSGTPYWKGSAETQAQARSTPLRVTIETASSVAGKYCFTGSVQGTAGTNYTMSVSNGQVPSVSKFAASGTFNSCLDLPATDPSTSRKLTVTVNSGGLVVWSFTKK